MPYVDPEKQREYQREWMQRRRDEWLRENGPCVGCGKWETLEVDHIDPATKVSHRVWSWSRKRREAELAKCQALCFECHKKKSDQAMKVPTPHGTHSGYAYHGCRCEPCSQAQAEHMRSWRSR